MFIILIGHVIGKHFSGVMRVVIELNVEEVKRWNRG